jgi:T5orf172 domain
MGQAQGERPLPGGDDVRARVREPLSLKLMGSEMTDYQYKNIPLTPSIAAEHIVEYLSKQMKPVKRVELTRHVADRHLESGGLVLGNPGRRVMHALARLTDERTITNPSLGWYCIAGAAAVHFDATLEDGSAEAFLPVEAELIVSEESIGQGDELIYVYFHDADRKLAKYEDRDWWPCKVGFTAGNLTTRILAQGPSTSMARPPIVGLVIKTEDGHALERALHYALDESGARIAEALGSEWFDTSPNRIKAWHERYLHAVDVLRR